jgi:hypothetical protein
MPSDHLTTADTYRQDFPDGPVILTDLKLAADTAPLRGQVWRYERMFRAMLREGWGFTPPDWLAADPPPFVFPAWGPRWRPFDWAVDA